MRLNTDRVVSLSAMVVGLGSLFIIIYQTALLREQQAASALPYLMVGVMANADRTYIIARNTGSVPRSSRTSSSATRAASSSKIRTISFATCDPRSRTDRCTAIVGV